MSWFSQRKGLKPAEKIIQIDSIDDELRNLLWSALHDYVFTYLDQTNEWGTATERGEEAHFLAEQFWTDFLKRRSDELSALHKHSDLKELILSGPWNEVYDAMEFVLSNLSQGTAHNLGQRWNQLLIQENAGYRLVNNQIVDITSETEIAEIERSLASEIVAVKEHIEAALTFLSDRKNPDYRNSIKESISAVESVCRLIGGGKTLDEALKRIKSKIGLHPALEKGFTALYGYTSDKGGIRHALLEESSIDAADARFMLVACSSFVNFLVSKASQLGITIS